MSNESSSRVAHVRCRVASLATARGGFIALAAVGVAIIVASAVLMAFPDSGWMFVDDTLVRIRNAVFIVFGIMWVWASRYMFLMATGRMPVVVVQIIDAETVCITARHLLPWVRRRSATLECPVSFTSKSAPSSRILPGVLPRWLRFSSGSHVFEAGTLWEWDDASLEHLDRVLRGV